MTNEELYSGITRAIATRTADGCEPSDAILTLSPALIQDVIDKKLIIPTEVNGVPIRISEALAKINKPSGRYMVTCMVGRKDRAGRKGHIFFAEVAS